MNSPYWDDGSRACFKGGLLLTLASTVHSNDLVKTAVLAVVGSVVSFGMSLLLRWLRKEEK
jgi:hypothetical protein